MAGMTWEEVIASEKYIGGDLEFINTAQCVHRGPVKEIRLRDDMVYFDLEWLAIMQWGEWVYAPAEIPPLFNHWASVGRPIEISGGRIHYTMPIVGRGTLFPKGSSNFGRDQVTDREFVWD